MASRRTSNRLAWIRRSALAAAIGLNRLMTPLLFGVQATDTGTFVAVVLTSNVAGPRNFRHHQAKIPQARLGRRLMC